MQKKIQKAPTFIEFFTSIELTESDYRPSAYTIGGGMVAFMVTIGILLLMLDSTALYRDFRGNFRVISRRVQSESETE